MIQRIIRWHNRRSTIHRTGGVLLFIVLAGRLAAQDAAPIRPPAIPLIAHDPYFSVWSTTDTLTNEPTRHWTGAEQALTGLVRVDGKVYRYMGRSPAFAQPAIDAMRQVAFRITPTRTMYGFEAGGIHLDLTFLTPSLPNDLDVLSRPVTYVTWEVRSTDGATHQVKLYLDATSSLVIDRDEEVRAMWSRHDAGNLAVVRLGALDQQVLARAGDDVRIGWGHLYLAAPRQQGGVETVGTVLEERGHFANTLEFPRPHDLDVPTFAVYRLTPVIGIALDAGNVGNEPVSRYAMVAYDDEYSVEYFNRRLRPYWRRDNKTGAEALLTMAARDYASLQAQSARFDETLTRDLVSAGGAKYAALATVAYRQTLAAHKLVADFDGTPMLFPKENFSGGFIGTVDVIFPSAPMFALLNPALLKALVRPVLTYASSPRWPWPYAPHDLGFYPLANGQLYGGGEDNEDRQMPVEESGNMLILMAVLAESEGNAEFSRQHWKLLTTWAEYLKAKGMDPENQLCTDDFAGHLAHNTNLSIKAIVALGAYARIAAMLGENGQAALYEKTAHEMAVKWERMANDGDHYRLTFDKPGTWSQKYNLVWDKLLALRLFAPEISQKEIAYYKSRQNAFGLPLDNRATYTKLDWIVWTATLATNQRDFESLVDPAYRFANESSSRVPLSDWYWTLDGKQRGFQARSVVGGIFIKMLEDRARWRAWVERAR